MAKTERQNTLPSSTEDQKRIMGFVKEAVNVKVMIESQKDAYKEIREACLDEFPITAKLFNSIVKFEYKDNFEQVEDETDEIFSAYQRLKELIENV